MAHVAQERVLDTLHLLSLRFLTLQFFFSCLLLTDITAQAEVVSHHPALVGDWQQMELQRQHLITWNTDNSPNFSIYRGVATHIHAIH